MQKNSKITSNKKVALKLGEGRLQKIKCPYQLPPHLIHSVSGVHHGEAKQREHEANANLSGAYLVHVALKHTAGASFGFCHMLRVSIWMNIHDSRLQREKLSKNIQREKMKPKMSVSSSGSGSSASWLKELKSKQKVFSQQQRLKTRMDIATVFTFSSFVPTQHGETKKTALSCYLAHPRKRFLRNRRFFILLHQN